MDEFAGYSPDAAPNEGPYDEEAEEVERYARARVGDSDTETGPAAPKLK